MNSRNSHFTPALYGVRSYGKLKPLGRTRLPRKMWRFGRGEHSHKVMVNQVGTRNTEHGNTEHDRFGSCGGGTRNTGGVWEGTQEHGTRGTHVRGRLTTRAAHRPGVQARSKRACDSSLGAGQMQILPPYLTWTADDEVAEAVDI